MLASDASAWAAFDRAVHLLVDEGTLPKRGYRADEEVRGLKTAAAVLEVRARACPAEPVDRVEGPDIQPQCRQCAIQQDVVPGVEQRRGQCARFPD